MRLAAIGIGSNSTRLLVAERGGRAGTPMPAPEHRHAPFFRFAGRKAFGGEHGARGAGCRFFCCARAGRRVPSRCACLQRAPRAMRRTLPSWMRWCARRAARRWRCSPVKRRRFFLSGARRGGRRKAQACWISAAVQRSWPWAAGTGLPRTVSLQLGSSRLSAMFPDLTGEGALRALAFAREGIAEGCMAFARTSPPCGSALEAMASGWLLRSGFVKGLMPGMWTDMRSRWRWRRAGRGGYRK